MKSRLAWMLHRRLVLESQIPGFRADVRSYADPACVFSPYNTIQRNTLLTNVHLGPFSYVAANTKCSECRIGAFSSIGPDGLIGGLGRHPTRWLSTHPAFYSTKRRAGAHFANRDRYDEFVLTEIGSDVFIGARAIVLDGVRIGHGAIVAAGAVVAKDVAPFAVVAGTPATVVRLRFDEAVIEALLDWKWWDLPLEQLQRVHELFTARTDWRVENVDEIRRVLRGS